MALGWLRPLDFSLSAAAVGGTPCWGQLASQAASPLLAGELSLLYAGAIGLLCVTRRRPWAGLALVLLLLSTVAVETTFKLFFNQPAPSLTALGVERPECWRVPYPLTSVPPEVLPNSLPSGYSIRVAYFGLLLTVLIGARWPRLARPARLGLIPIVLVLGATRVAVGWHWTSDVLAGLLLGGAAAFVALALADGFRWLRPLPGEDVSTAPSPSGRGLG